MMLVHEPYYHPIWRPGASPEFSILLHTSSMKDGRLPSTVRPVPAIDGTQHEKEIDSQ
jgi:hypothetical protein